MHFEFPKVYTFNSDNFATVVSLASHGHSVQSIKAQRWFKYFVAYLSEPDSMDAQTMIIEQGYTSAAYRGDFLSNYAKRHREYSKYTVRIHFFSIKSGPNGVREYLLTETKESKLFWKSYLGYIVIKPVSSGVFGATLLKPYKEDNKGRKFPVVTKELVHFLGREFIINSLGFQQQDISVGACATNALWSAFHKTSRLFGTEMPSPYNITLKASLHSNVTELITDQDFGLKLPSIIQVFHSLNLGWDSIYRSPNHGIGISHQQLKLFVHAYVSAGLPVLLGYVINKEHHLVTVTGYSIPKSSFKNHKSLSSIPVFRAHNIDRLFAHDDLIGPFSKIEFNTALLEFRKKDSLGNYVVESKMIDLLDCHFINGKCLAKGQLAIAAMVPLAKNISVRLSSIEKSVIKFHRFFFYNHVYQNLNVSNINWEIQVISGVDYKVLAKKTSGASDQLKLKVVSSSYPKYLWIARLWSNEQIILDVVYDASEVGNGFCCIQFNVYSEDFKKGLLQPLIGAQVLNSAPKRISKISGGHLFNNHVVFMLMALIENGKEVTVYRFPNESSVQVSEWLKNNKFKVS